MASGAAPLTTPSAPSATASTSRGPGSEDMMTSASRAASRGVSAQAAPCSRAGPAASRRTSVTTSSWPCSWRLATIRLPMVLRPMKATRIVALPRTNRPPPPPPPPAEQGRGPAATIWSLPAMVVQRSGEALPQYSRLPGDRRRALTGAAPPPDPETPLFTPPWGPFIPTAPRPPLPHAGEGGVSGTSWFGVPVRASGMSGGYLLKFAWTLASALRVMVHPFGSTPVQAPLEPRKVLPASGVAVSATVVPAARFAAQGAPQLIPAGAPGAVAGIYLL